MLTLLNDRYEVLEFLGAGGEAQIVKALDRRHDRVVALKVRPVPDAGSRDELLAEARPVFERLGAVPRLERLERAESALAAGSAGAPARP